MLIARIGLHWEVARTCIGQDGIVTAKRDGIVYDLGLQRIGLPASM